jgi:hypothetical protein
LARALNAAGIAPLIVNRPHAAAFVGALRFGSVPIMVIDESIWWPGATQDFAGTRAIGRLQHELQHVLDYAEGRLTVTRYLLEPHNWTYRWSESDPTDWDRLGAEQRASMAEALWHAERSREAKAVARTLRSKIPWAMTASP